MFQISRTYTTHTYPSLFSYSLHHSLAQSRSKVTGGPGSNICVGPSIGGDLVLGLGWSKYPQFWEVQVENECAFQLLQFRLQLQLSESLKSPPLGPSPPMSE